jgi:hypothetical protein
MIRLFMWVFSLITSDLGDGRRAWLARSAPDEGFVTLVPTILPVGVYTGS